MEEIIPVEIPQLQVLGIRKRGHYRIIPELIGQLFEVVMRNHMTIVGMPIYLHHEGSKEQAMEADRTGTGDVEVVVPVDGKVREGGETRIYILPGGKMTRIIHKGPYEACEPTYNRLFEWIAAKGLQVKGPIREIYHNNPREVKPEDILTEILAPVG